MNKETTSDLNETIASATSASDQISTASTSNKSLSELVEQASNSVICEQLTKPEDQKTSEGTNELNTLALITKLFEKSVQKINDESDDTLKSADASVINDLVEWCIMSWYSIASRINTDRVVFDLCKEYDKFVNSDMAKSDDGF